MTRIGFASVVRFLSVVSCLILVLGFVALLDSRLAMRRRLARSFANPLFGVDLSAQRGRVSLEALPSLRMDGIAPLYDSKCTTITRIGQIRL